jgi:hypothetical protein
MKKLVFALFALAALATIAANPATAGGRCYKVEGGYVCP